MLGKVYLSDSQIFETIITIFVAVFRPEVLRKIIQQYLPTAKVWLLTKFNNLVQGLQIFIFAPHSVVLVSHNKVLQPLAISVAVV